jgi:hypothetical protein
MAGGEVHRQGQAITHYAGFQQALAAVSRRRKRYKLLKTCDQMAIMPTNKVSDARAAASWITALNMVLSPERTGNIVHVLFLCQA